MEEERRVKESEVLIRIANQVGHDIQSPISALKTLRSHFYKIDPDYLELLDSITERIQSIANDLLVIPANRSNSPKAIQSLGYTNVASLARELIKEKRLEIPDRVTLDLHFLTQEGDDNLSAKCDSSGLQRVLSNLINNAAEAISKDGTIEMTISRRANHLLILISDNGKGMSADELASLGTSPISFNKTKSNHSGHGLGVSGAFQWVQANHGSIHFSSSPGRGTVVTVQLPAAPQSPETHPSG
jgi:signal transduction histidine kinase